MKKQLRKQKVLMQGQLSGLAEQIAKELTLEDVITPGWAASNNGGGEIRTNKKLAAFLEEANRRIKE